MADLDTTIDGSPAAIRRVAEALKGTFGDDAAAMADTAFHGRQTGVQGWEGTAGEAFGARARILAKAADDASSSAQIAGRHVDDLAHALDTTQQEMLRIRAAAAAAGLTVHGGVVVDPGPRLSAPDPLPPDPTLEEAAAQQHEEERVRLQNAKVDAFEKAAQDARAADTAWSDAIGQASVAKVRWDKEIAGLVADFLGGVGGSLPALASVPAYQRALAHSAQAAAKEAHVSYFKDHWPTTATAADREHFYRLQDEAMEARRTARTSSLRWGLLNEDKKVIRTTLSMVEEDPALGVNRTVTRAASTGKAIRGLGKGLGLLGVGATLYSVHEDLEQGESQTQAWASNVGGMGASIATGALVGAAVGTAIPIPVVGTVAGAVVGAAAGTIMGAWTSGVIDSAFTNGLTSMEGLEKAYETGAQEIANTVDAIGDTAGDAVEAVAGAGEAVADAVGSTWTKIFG